jgi:hypothetical protein
MNQLTATGQLYGKTVTIKRITKAAARKAFSNGIEVYLQSSNMRPFGVWQSICPIKLDRDQLQADKNHYEWCKNGGYQLPSTIPTEESQFDYMALNYSWYNCDSERGNYVHFYIAI